ncbi:hypothetical protein SAMN05444272_4547 [Roseibium suaedae]|uniref:Uncharacterized protein n=1 Tax=Roseibium suaedae TaxID=735517 RepID=A0A1M7PNL4_9HYPH|nr:hypothetical protein SAMN05444272_4547 [Roseibium suaedae]
MVWQGNLAIPAGLPILESDLPRTLAARKQDGVPHDRNRNVSSNG